MTNYERIKKMSVEEMANWLGESDSCVLNREWIECSDDDICSTCIRKWLLKDVDYADKNKEIGELIDWLKNEAGHYKLGDYNAIPIRKIREKIDQIMNKTGD